MQHPRQPHLSSDPDQDNAYPFSGNSAATNLFASRSASKYAAFFLPQLRPGIRLLDCGCGPRSITIDLAEIVAPGQVAGIDVDTKSLERARELAAVRNVSNIRFETGNFYDFPFPDGTVDAGFSNGILDYLRNPLAALAEMSRVLRSGGVVGIRSADSDGHIFAPPDPMLSIWSDLIDQTIERSGGNPRIGKTLRALLNKAGFVNVEASASYEAFGNQEALHLIYNSMVLILFKTDWADVDMATLENVSAALKEWSMNPDAFAGQCWCEAVGWVKEE